MLPCISLTSLLPLLPLPYLTLAGPYDRCSTTTRIKWRNTENGPWDWTESPHVDVWFSKEPTAVDSGKLDFQVDTGSCGIIAGKDDVSFDEMNEKINIAYQWLSSSEILYTGWWVWRWVWFNHADSAREVKAWVPVLALDKKLTHCKHWTPDQKATCEGAIEEPDPKTQLLGISYGRMYDGQPLGDPGKNPLLKIYYMATGDVFGGRYCPGWIIDSYGIQLGLTPTVWPPVTETPGEQASSREIQLGADPGAPPRPLPPGTPRHYRAWGEIPGCVQVQNPASRITAPCTESSILLDTGMNPDHASIRLPQAQVDNLDRHADHNVKPGHVITIKFGESGTTRTRLERYTADNTPFFACDITPAHTNVYADDPAFHNPARFPFANSGRHVYRRWNTGYDPVRGVARLDRHGLMSSIAGVPKKEDPTCRWGCGLCLCRTCFS